MKKSETVAMLRDAFLAGKDAEAIEKFDAKDLEKQYISVMNWKRRQKLLKEGAQKAESTIADVVNNIKKAHKNLHGLADLSEKDKNKLYAAVKDFTDAVENFDKMKKQQKITDLENEQNKLEQMKNDLARKIEELRQQL